MNDEFQHSGSSEPAASYIGALSVHRFKGKVPEQIVVGGADYYRRPTLSLPANGLTVLYGHRGAANVMSASLQEVSGKGQIAIVEFKINVGRWNPNKQKFADFESSRFLNLPARSSAPVMDDIKRRWNHWLTLEGKPEENFPREPSENMHLLDKLMEVEPYNHLAAIAYEVVTEVGLAKFMTVYDVDAIDLDSVVVGPGIEAEVVFEV